MHDTKMLLARIMERVIGRKTLVRSARFLLDYSRRDLPNQLGTNGEWMVQDIILAHRGHAPLTVLDIGAHVGAWSRRLVDAARAAKSGITVHAFEPSPRTFRELQSLTARGYRDYIVTVNAAASNEVGSASLFEVHELAGSNSLHGYAGRTEGLEEVPVDLVSIDQYSSEAGIRHVELLKIDAEGHDALVLDGARWLLSHWAIEVVQFEYNFRWIGARRFLKDVFDTLEPLGYRIGKVTPSGIEWYPTWGPELETYREANYVAVLPEWVSKFPAIEWWNNE